MHKAKQLKLNLEAVFESIKTLLSKIHSLGIVHGDYRLNNIIARQSSQNPSIITDFKVIDFEFSGKVNEKYPVIFDKSPIIAWHRGFSSNSKREYDHDNCFIEVIKSDLGVNNNNIKRNR